MIFFFFFGNFVRKPCSYSSFYLQRKFPIFYLIEFLQFFFNWNCLFNFVYCKNQRIAVKLYFAEPLPALNGSTRVVKAGLERRYVPLGRHFVFECEVLDIVYTNGYQVLDYAWVAIYGTLKRRTVLPRDPDDYTNLNSR